MNKAFVLELQISWLWKITMFYFAICSFNVADEVNRVILYWQLGKLTEFLQSMLLSPGVSDRWRQLISVTVRICKHTCV